MMESDFLSLSQSQSGGDHKNFGNGIHTSYKTTMELKLKIKSRDEKGNKCKIRRNGYQLLHLTLLITLGTSNHTMIFL
jgi:hypothetical protein